MYVKVGGKQENVTEDWRKLHNGTTWKRDERIILTQILKK
jgi:hypothetical protein